MLGKITVLVSLLLLMDHGKCLRNVGLVYNIMIPSYLSPNYEIVSLNTVMGDLLPTYTQVNSHQLVHITHDGQYYVESKDVQHKPR